MDKQTVDISQTDVSWRELIDRYGRDVVLVIKDGDTYVGSMHIYDRPYEVPRRMMGMHAGLVEMPDDFDDPLPESFWFSESEQL